MGKSRFGVLFLALIGILVLAGGLTSGTALAQTEWITAEGDVVFRVGGDTTIGPDETTSTVLVIDGNLVVDGRITQALMVVNGNVTVNGQVDGEMLVVNGTVDLATDSTVNDLALVNSQLNQASGAVITGTLDEDVNVNALGWGLAAISFVFWIGLTVVILIAGLVFAALGYEQLVTTAQTLLTQPGPSVLTALIVWIGLPLLAFLSFITVIGIPLGLLIIFLIMPILALLGYIVAGELVGRWLGSVVNMPPHRYGTVLVGLIALQLVGLVPVIGGPIATIAGLAGTGALVYRIFRGSRGPHAAPAVPPGATLDPL